MGSSPTAGTRRNLSSPWLTREVGVAPVPGSSFYSRPELGRRFIRFAFCKTLPMLEDAARRLATAGRGDAPRTSSPTRTS